MRTFFQADSHSREAKTPDCEVEDQGWGDQIGVDVGQERRREREVMICTKLG